jgi:hypothetical protein
MSEEKLGFLEASLDFDKNTLYLEGSLIGAEVDFEFRDRNFSMCFPNFDLKEIAGKEARDIVFYKPKTTSRGTNVEFDWFKTTGDRRPYGRAGLDIKTQEIHRFSCSQVVIRSKYRLTQKEATAAKNDLIIWKNMFIGWLGVLSFQDYTESDLKVDQEEDLEAYIVNLPGNNTKPVVEKTERGADIIFTGRLPSILTAEDIKKAAGRCSLDLFPSDMHLRLINSLKLYNQDEFRQSLLDSATATEMALTTLLDLRLKDVETDVRLLIAKKYTQIGNLLEALGDLGVNLAFKDIYKKIAEPRNKAIHKGAIVDKIQAEDALKVAKNLVYEFLKI